MSRRCRWADFQQSSASRMCHWARVDHIGIFLPPPGWTSQQMYMTIIVDIDDCSLGLTLCGGQNAGDATLLVRLQTLLLGLVRRAVNVQGKGSQGRTWKGTTSMVEDPVEARGRYQGRYPGSEYWVSDAENTAVDRVVQHIRIRSKPDRNCTRRGCQYDGHLSCLTQCPPW